MKIETQMQVAKNMRYLRNVFGYTQTEVADGIHMCRSTYALYEYDLNNHKAYFMNWEEKSQARIQL